MAGQPQQSNTRHVSRVPLFLALSVVAATLGFAVSLVLSPFFTPDCASDRGLRVVIMGPPASGKGTQCDFIGEGLLKL